jgi:hypothetical protein
MSNANQKTPKRSTRWAVRGLLAGLLALALGYLRCSGELGLGGGGSVSKGKEPVTSPPAPREDGQLRCQLRLDGAGLWLLGPTGQLQTEVAAAVASCKVSAGADVVITGEARQGAWDELRAELAAAGVAVFVRGGTGAGGTASQGGGADPKGSGVGGDPVR